jgi:hypothetical protein
LVNVPKCCRNIEGAVIKANQSGSMDGPMFQSYINEILKPDLESLVGESSVGQGMLMLDRAGAHLVDYVSLDLENLQVDTVIIRPGQTCCTQPVDVSINGPCKSQYKDEWSKHFKTNVAYTPAGNRKKLPYHKMVHMVMDVLKSVKSETICNSFVTCGLAHHEDNFDPVEFIGKNDFF